MMRELRRISLLAAALAALPLAAQSGYTYGIKFGAGPVVSSAGDQKAHAAINFALSVERPLNQRAILFCELGYRFFRAEDHEVTRFGTGYAPGGATGPIVNTSSVDIRKDMVEGYVFNGGYRAVLSGPWSWQAGLTVARMVSNQEVTGQIQVGTYREGLNYVVSKSALSVGAFAGLRLKATDAFFVELNLSSVGFSQANYVPFAYTGQAPTTTSQTKNKVVLDANLGFRF
ncbi:MAG: hypothetical protein HY823_08625 [Acidobacteria bacterium]|nr:hypothetical protein [Acidobacteriota bacterium]